MFMQSYYIYCCLFWTYKVRLIYCFLNVRLSYYIYSPMLHVGEGFRMSHLVDEG